MLSLDVYVYRDRKVSGSLVWNTFFDVEINSKTQLETQINILGIGDGALVGY